MIFEGDRTVIEAIREKKHLIASAQPHDHIRPYLFIDGGLMKGAYGVGGSIALEELGYGNSFNYVTGVSSGAPIAAYFVAGQAKIGSSLVWSVGCSKKFINMWRFWNQVQTGYLMEAIKSAPAQKLDAEKVLASRTALSIAVSNFSNGEPFILHPDTEEELYKAIQASMLLPNVSTDIIEFEDIRYVDGGFTRPHAIKKVLEEIDPTHVLIITNQEKAVTTIPKLERFLNHTIYRHRMPKPLRFAAHERKRERLKALAEMEAHGLPYAMVWGDRSIRSMERDIDKVQEVIEKSRQWWTKLLTE